MTYNNKEILQRANEAISQGDYEGFLAHCTEDTTWIFIGEQTLTGKDAVRKWMADTYKEPPVFEASDLIAEGDFVTAVGTITLPNSDGKKIKNAYCDVWQFRDGRMAGLRAFVIEEKEDSQ